jgi:hypothetical protein
MVDPEACLPASPVFDRDSTRRFARRTLSAHTALYSSLAHGHSNIMIVRGDGAAGFAPEDVWVLLRIAPPELRLGARDKPVERFADGIATFSPTVNEPGFRLARFRGLVPFPHQRLDAGSVFVPQPVRQLPEHDMVDVPEYGRSEVGELVERCPTGQLPVEASDHVDRADTMIAGEGLGQFANKPLGLLLGYRRDDRHTSVRPSLANDSVPQKDEAIVDVGDMGFVHIQRQLQFTFQKGTAFLTDLFCLSLGSFYDHDKVVSVSAVGDGRLPLPVLTNRNGTALLDAEVPCPSILTRLVAEVFRLKPRIKLMEHDVGQER